MLLGPRLEQILQSSLNFLEMNVFTFFYSYSKHFFKLDLIRPKMALAQPFILFPLSAYHEPKFRNPTQIYIVNIPTFLGCALKIAIDAITRYQFEES